MHPAGLLIEGGTIATGGGGQTGQHFPSGVYCRLGPHHTDGQVARSQGWRIASKQGRGQKQMNELAVWHAKPSHCDCCTIIGQSLMLHGAGN